MADVKCNVYRGTVQGPGNQQVKVPLGGDQPKVGIFQVNSSTTTNTAQDEIINSIGIYAPAVGGNAGVTNQVTVLNYSRDNQNTSRTASGSRNDAVVAFPNVATTGLQYRGEATPITDGFELDWTVDGTLTAQQMVAELWSGADLQAHLYYMDSPGGTNTTVTCGFRPDIVRVFGVGMGNTGLNTISLGDAGLTEGAQDEGNNGRCLGLSYSHNTANSGGRACGYTVYKAALASDNGTLHRANIDNFTSSGYRIVMENLSRPLTQIMFLAMRFGGNGFDVRNLNTPNASSGTQTVSGLGFNPTFHTMCGGALAGNTSYTTRNRNKQQTSRTVKGDSGSMVMYHYNDRNQATTNTISRVETNYNHWSGHLGNDVSPREHATIIFGTGQYQVDWSLAEGNNQGSRNLSVVVEATVDAGWGAVELSPANVNLSFPVDVASTTAKDTVNPAGASFLFSLQEPSLAAKSQISAANTAFVLPVDEASVEESGPALELDPAEASFVFHVEQSDLTQKWVIAGAGTEFAFSTDATSMTTKDVISPSAAQFLFPLQASSLEAKSALLPAGAEFSLPLESPGLIVAAAMNPDAVRWVFPVEQADVGMAGAVSPASTEFGFALAQSSLVVFFEIDPDTAQFVFNLEQASLSPRDTLTPDGLAFVFSVQSPAMSTGTNVSPDLMQFGFNLQDDGILAPRDTVEPASVVYGFELAQSSVGGIVGLDPQQVRFLFELDQPTLERLDLLYPQGVEFALELQQSGLLITMPAAAILGYMRVEPLIKGKLSVQDVIDGRLDVESLLKGKLRVR